MSLSEFNLDATSTCTFNSLMSFLFFSDQEAKGAPGKIRSDDAMATTFSKPGEFADATQRDDNCVLYVHTWGRHQVEGQYYIFLLQLVQF